MPDKRQVIADTFDHTRLKSPQLPLLAYAFRPTFLLLSAYVVVSIVLWGMVWSGLLSISFMQDVLTWHIYEMLFGVASGGIIGFMLTALPEFFPDLKPITGRTLLALVALWFFGRIGFWLIDFLGVLTVATLHLPLLLGVIVWAIPPVWRDPQKRHLSLVVTLAIIWFIQCVFFASKLGVLHENPQAALYASLGAFMVLVLLTLRRVSTAIVNNWLEQRQIDEIFIARPPRYNIAILCIGLFTVSEYLMPGNRVLAWLGFAVTAALLNTLNDLFLTKAVVIFDTFILPLALVLIFISLGYGLMGFAYLENQPYQVSHFRHFLTTGALGLAFYSVMIIVGMVHTGRPLVANNWIRASIMLIAIATLIRASIPFFMPYSQWMYLASALIWALPFLIYFVQFYPMLSRPRIDGLPG
ncbi:NnrS family protein [Neptunomonas sp. XY-337]|uniref:NnrS family protein n=1 Tax=Neptunomonas sp. XY-337 TaxID=2561897 RepID=UPI0010AA4D13|nr:NnrS family protein [Neptunomonas sp. XY-337]